MSSFEGSVSGMKVLELCTSCVVTVSVPALNVLVVEASEDTCKAALA
jgi:hypothetical protein